MARYSPHSARPSPLAAFLAVLASCGGTAAVALALEWLEQRAAGAGTKLVLAVLLLLALALALVVALLRRRRAGDALDSLPTITLAPEPRSADRAAPPVSRVALPRSRQVLRGDAPRAGSA